MYIAFTTVIFQVLMAGSVIMTALLDIVLCSLVEVYRRIRDANCIHIRPDDEGSITHRKNRSTLTTLHDAISHKGVICNSLLPFYIKITNYPL
jgi:hypothetical protein